MDFVSDRLADGRWFRILTVVDQCTRECLCTYADRSQTGEKVVEQLKRLVSQRGIPESITSDNGSEFAGQAMDAWAHRTGVKLDFTGQAGQCRTRSSRASTDAYATSV
jgi:putative transposase